MTKRRVVQIAVAAVAWVGTVGVFYWAGGLTLVRSAAVGTVIVGLLAFAHSTYIEATTIAEEAGNIAAAANSRAIKAEKIAAQAAARASLALDDTAALGQWAGELYEVLETVCRDDQPDTVPTIRSTHPEATPQKKGRHSA